MKHFILAAAILLAVAVPASSKGFYLQGYGGANIANSFGDDAGWIAFDSGTQTGYVIGGALGTSINAVPGLRVEADLNFRHNGLIPVVDICGSLYTFKGSDQTWALLSNAVYDIDVGKFPLKPYVLLGAGYGSRTLSAQLSGWDAEATESGFVWQAGAGANYTMAPGVVLGFGYRFFEAPSIGRDVGPVVVDADGENHSFIGSVAFSFE